MTRRVGFVVSVALLAPVLVVCFSVVGIAAGVIGGFKMLADDYREI